MDKITNARRLFHLSQILLCALTLLLLLIMLTTTPSSASTPLAPPRAECSTAALYLPVIQTIDFADSASKHTQQRQLDDIPRNPCVQPAPWGDLGDAPDGLAGIPMTAYITLTTNLTTPTRGRIAAHFPTVFFAGVPSGPFHYVVSPGAYLGSAISLEENAYTISDTDGLPNLDLINDLADMDGGDDGLNVVYDLQEPCIETEMAFTVTVESGFTGTVYANAWFDFNRDGYWDGVDYCHNLQRRVKEWAVQDAPITVAPGTTQLITLSLTTFHFDESVAWEPMWLRLTLSEGRGDAPPDGSGPSYGYLYGETEDYLLTPLCKPNISEQCRPSRVGWTG